MSVLSIVAATSFAAAAAPQEVAPIDATAAAANLKIDEVLDQLEHQAQRIADPADGIVKTHLVNREKQIRAWVGDDGSFSLADRTRSDLSVFLQADGFESGPAELVGDEVVSHGALGQQFWINTSDGIEHLLVLAAPTAVRGAEGEEVVSIFTSGLRPILRSFDEVIFRGNSGPSLRYRNLAVFDRVHRRQTAWFEVDGSTVEIHVLADADAEWPLTIDPLAQSSSPTISGTQAAARFGFATATGDVNNDTYADLAVGAPRFASPEVNEGRVFVFLGSSSGLNLASPLTFESNLAAANCGETVAIGDVSGDSLDDLVYGCPGEGSGDGRLRVHVQAGSTLPAVANFVLNDAFAASPLGRERTLALANLDGSGRLEIASAHPGALCVWNLQDALVTPDSCLAQPTARGIARVQKLETTSARDAVAISTVGQVTFFRGQSTGYISASDTLVLSVSTGSVPGTIAAGDFSGDGLTDVVVGAPGAAGGGSAGQAFVFRNTGGAFTSALTVTGGAGDELGGSVFMGDLNSDRHDEVVICAPRKNAQSGECIVRSGNTVGTLDSTLRLTAAGTGGESLGNTNLTAGDFNGDGGADLVLPAFQNTSFQGRVLVFDGDRGTLSSTVAATFEVDKVNAAFGNTVVLSDIDADGRADIIVGAPGFDNGQPATGAVFAFAGGQTMSTTPVWVQNGTLAYDGFGSSIAVGRFRSATTGPVIAVGSPGNDTAGTSAGSVDLFFTVGGSFPPSNTTPGQTFFGSHTNDQFGAALANAKNLINTIGDALAVGAPQTTKTPPSLDGGYVSIFHANGGNLSFNSNITGLSAPINCSSSFGAALAGVGNVDGAQRDDLLVGAPDCDSGNTDEGKAVLVVSGAIGTATVSTWAFEVNQDGAALGAAVAGLGDVTGDGVADFAIGAPKMDNTNAVPTVVDAGRVYVFKGKSTGLPSTTQLVSMSTGFAANCGASIAGRADINRDGLMDMIEGEPSFGDPGQEGEGRIRVFLGAPGSMETVPVRTLEGGCAGCRMGAAVALGDVNMDGFADAAIGRPGLSNPQVKEGDVRVFFGTW